MMSAQSDVVVRLSGLNKSYGPSKAVDNIDLTVGRGELVCLVGPSGCGKTTTLKMIAGFVLPTSGAIELSGVDVSMLPPQKRDTGMVFQNYALFPHMTVAQNVAFGPENVSMPRKEIDQRVDELLSLVQMSHLAKRFPHELSGGQQQRVALARALALRPVVLLLDEPLSNLDAKLRLQMREEIRNLVSVLGITTILVTHDQEEALAIADRLVVMNEGRIEQIGSPIDVYETPATRFVAEFIGTCNLIPVRRGAGDAILLPNGASIPFDGKWPSGDAVLSVRSEHLTIVAPGGDAIPARVLRVVFLGSFAHVRTEMAGQEIIVQTTADQARGLAADADIGIAINPRRFQLL